MKVRAILLPTLFFVFFPLSSLLFAKVEGPTIVSKKHFRYSFLEVCQSLGKKHLLIVEAVNTWQIDCMGERVRVASFCKKRPLPRPFLRAYVDEKAKEVICETGDALYLSIICDKKDKYLCQNQKSEKNCQKLRRVYAQDLELIHHSLIPTTLSLGVAKEKKKRKLNCYYAKSEAMPSKRHL